MLLENKIAVVYGAGGVGNAVARAFARDGARVFLAARTLNRIEPLAQEIVSVGGRAEVAAVDALDEAAVKAHIDDVVSKAGRIDVLFNAIAMQDFQGPPLIEMSVDDFTRPIMVATRSQFLTAQAVARQMVQQRSGVIMTITAGPSRRAVSNVGGFDPACAALESLWRSFAAELGQYGIRLVVIGSAGSVDTPDVQATLALHAKATGVPLEQIIADSGKETLLGRLPGVAEVANAAVMMASDYASAMTGVIANVTCGYVVD